MSDFKNPYEVINQVSVAFQPPERIPVYESANKYLNISQPGGFIGTYSLEETPYMKEPMDMLSSRKHDSVCFVGPSRSGKTLSLVDAWITHTVTNDPGDFLLVSMTQEKARDYSKTRLERNIRNSSKLRSLLTSRTKDNNTYDKLFNNGMYLKIGWPTASQLASSDYRYVAFTDYDRIADNIDGEGSAFQLGRKRITTFLSRGMCLVESSPGREITDPGWTNQTLHEAPPTSGILSIYNNGDRRQYYFKCIHCEEYFRVAPGLSLFKTLPEDQDLYEIIREADLSSLAREHSFIYCDHCGSRMGPEDKINLLNNGTWLRDGQTIDSDGIKSDTGINSNTASYWLSGVCASYQSWESIILRYLQGLRDYISSGDESLLQATCNTDQAIPYLPKLLTEEKFKYNISKYAEVFPKYIVPEDARFITAAVDVQGGQNPKFVVQVHAHGKDHEQWLIDRYDITDSPYRLNHSIDPASYPEDWEVLVDKVINSTYRTHIEDLELKPKLVIVDSGGEAGVTENAYRWMRSLRLRNLFTKAILYKGASSPQSQIIRITKVGGRYKDLPLLLCNSNLLKDSVSNAARGGGLHFPKWLKKKHFDEFTAEVRQPNGTWKAIRKRNETLDLSCLNRAASIYLAADKINWNNPPPWARPVESNSESITREERRNEQSLKINYNRSSNKPKRRTNRSVGSSDWNSRI